ncbi:uncharacterized protein TrAtP1_010945 [Trichoderma atroviride]|uniref:uncharacterized protein n=1 Tax=Hypocrea atroviridis TaxID=63577 RepID=UPI00332C47C5|nr:hypothetical protein TrAtP1_010945 [Trichoderma atroviride]
MMPERPDRRQIVVRVRRCLLRTRPRQVEAKILAPPLLQRLQMDKMRETYRIGLQK